MTVHPDLAPYDPDDPDGPVRVGWLGGTVPTVGYPPDGLAFRLHVPDVAVHSPEGDLHTCLLCPESKQRTGTGHLRYRAENGTVYVAPRLVGHYVKDHRYAPPAGFVAAVMAGGCVIPERPERHGRRFGFRR